MDSLIVIIMLLAASVFFGFAAVRDLRSALSRDEAWSERSAALLLGVFEAGGSIVFLMIIGSEGWP